ncbi:MAG: ABC transporter substrate-binding protein [Candidatus Hodarchaeota archaeon]
MTRTKVKNLDLSRYIRKLLVIAFILNFSLFCLIYRIELPPPYYRDYPIKMSLLFASTVGPTDMDPHMCYDRTGRNVITQICENLYKFNVTDPAYSSVPQLAYALPSVTPDSLNITIPLKAGIKFSDGTPFNAEACKWNFDRLNYFLNYSGNQFLPAPFNVPLSPTVQVTKHYSLFTSGGIPIMNRTEIVDEYTIKIVMNIPKASVISLLNFHATAMMSPTATIAQGKELAMLTYADGDILIGTGPFIFQSYETDVEVKLYKNPNYWDWVPFETITDLTIWIIEDDIALNTAIWAGDIDLYDNPGAEFVQHFCSDPDITVVEAPSLNISYMGFNGYMVDTPYRKAISYAINYSYIIDVILSGNAYRLKSPIPIGIPLSNYGFNYPIFNRTYAQQLMQAQGHGTTFTTDAEWYAQGSGAGWGFGWNITAQTEGTTRRDIALYVSDNLKYIGINAPVVQISFWDIISCMEHDTGPLRRDKIPMYMFGWGPEYIDPENYITTLYSNTSAIWVNTWDHQLELLMLVGETTVDHVARKAIYDEIQRKLVEELFFFVWFTSGKNYDVYQNYVHGWVPNAIERVDLYPIWIY